ncbi:hypothetical protein HELRODRAFT_62045 [Helobdella robusta]|uniref:Retinoic acid receptor RXR n=1 Tax=Helobdella robusta TaxID=6412 RepID=T1FWU5_HELRO|nr:hypothetical protein HELRODRAFT_62045 [Helobdella robusta]ESO13203.1 hypothetical protein HELRODRAFT_62045 [Helobdella robusta]
MTSKHLCAICGDRASGKHYGVYSCEGCKGFFKRTVRKDLQYACRDEKNCLIDKRQRNRCQYCRYMKCLSTGMKREAVQEERQRARERGQAEAESTTCVGNDMPAEAILDAEMSLEQQLELPGDDTSLPYDFSQAADRIVYAMVDWAKRMPHFTELNPDDQVTLLKTGWNELIISTIAHQSISSSASSALTLVSGLRLTRESASQVGMTNIFDRILAEIVTKMKDMGIDKTELGCMRAIVLFNPDAKGLVSPQPVECLREKVYASLEDYCRQQAPDEPGRFAKLLLRLPALRSIGLKCVEHLFFFKMAEENVTMESFLADTLDSPNN